MQSIFSQINEELSQAVSKALDTMGYNDEDVLPTLSISKAFGDISSPIALKIAKRSKKNPDEIAKKLTASIKKPKYVSKITSENNFINFHLDRAMFCEMTIEQAIKEKELFSYPKSVKGKKALIEYPSVNPNKPWHIGHLRNALIGDALANVYDAMGYRIERQDYIDDFGLQAAEILWWKEKKELEAPKKKKFDHWLGEEYVKASAYIKEHDAKDEVAKTLALMEQDGTYESKLSRDISSECVKAQYETAFEFGIYHDVMVWESDIVREGLLEKALEMLKNHGFAAEQTDGDFKGCIAIDLSKAKDLPKELVGLNESKKVLVRSDGTPTYLAKDIAYHMWKFGLMGESFKYSLFIDKQPNSMPLYSTSLKGKEMPFGNASVVVNIIDTRQSHPQSILKLAFNAIGKENIADGMKHIAYGEVELESGSLSGRKGTWIGYSADEILEEATSKAKTLISSRFKFDDNEKDKIARAVALAAIKFEFLKFGIEKKIIFSWDRAMNFEGVSGPYHQYMHARANRIVQDAGRKREELEMPEITDREFELIKLIATSKDIVEKCCREGRPNIITDYMNELSSSFSKFYEFCPVLKAEKGTREFRIRLTEMFRDTSSSMLALLGIEALNKM